MDMKKGSFIMFLALCVLFIGLISCQQKSEAPAVAKQEASPPPPPAGQQQQPSGTQPPPPPPGAQQAPAAGEPSLEVKSHIKQGLSYVSVAKNANSHGIFNENIENAINEFSNAINKDPNYAEAYSNRGVAYMMQKKYNKALDDLKKAKELKPDSANIRYNLASCYSLMGSVDYGLDELDAALEKGFNNYDSLRKDSDITNLRKHHKEFRTILEKHKVFIN
jgi:tetratricopeptide (TPR) repeat protein